jgi:hypothetical protein
MLSTAQALTEWERVLKQLAEVKAHAAAHPDNPMPCQPLETRLNGSVVVLSRELASPVATLKQLLKKKVSTSLTHP